MSEDVITPEQRKRINRLLAAKAECEAGHGITLDVDDDAAIERLLYGDVADKQQAIVDAGLGPTWTAPAEVL